MFGNLQADNRKVGLLSPGRTDETIVTVSVDTEEDNWAPTRTGITVDNIRELPRLHQWFGTLGVRPTYFTTYHVAATPWAASIMREVAATGTAEIAAHLHPWNTPPMAEPLVPWLTMTQNLHPELREAKIRTLTDLLTSTLGARPKSFRAGRFGIGAEALAALVRCGYRVDSSVTPFVNWESVDNGPSHDGAPMAMHWLGAQGQRTSQGLGRIIEVPISLGYTRTPFTLWHRVHRILDSPALRPLRLVGMASRMRLIEKVILNPENDSVRSMVALARQLIARGTGYLHFFFHSPTLRPGATPFAPTRAATERILASLQETLDRLHSLTRIRFMTVAEMGASVAPEFMGAAGTEPTTVLEEAETASRGE